MRQHKFRGKRKDNGEWIDGYLFQNRDEVYIWRSRHGLGNYKIEIDPATVGEFTGLRDSKRTEEYPEGQEIYEGDVVNVYFGDYPSTLMSKAIIAYSNQCQFIADGDIENKGCWSLDSEHIEVVGTIHDAPEVQP